MIGFNQRGNFFELTSNPVKVGLYHLNIEAILLILSFMCRYALNAKSQSNHSLSSPNSPELNFSIKDFVFILYFFQIPSFSFHIRQHSTSLCFPQNQGFLLLLKYFLYLTLSSFYSSC